MEYRIRLAKIDDAPAFYGISLRAHTDSYYALLIPDIAKDKFYTHYTWSQEKEDQFTARIARKIAQPEWYVAVAEQQEKIIGYVIAHLKAEKQLTICSLFVDPDRHAKGVGTALFKTSLSWAKPGYTVDLSVIDANIVARSIYKKAGFKVAGKNDATFFSANKVDMVLRID